MRERHVAAANDGDKVAVWLKDRGEVTLKRIYHEGNKVRLQPANSTMEPIYTSPDNVEIQGRFISSIRPSDSIGRSAAFTTPYCAWFRGTPSR